MAFTIENAIVEFKSTGVDLVLAAAAKATSAITAIPDANVSFGSPAAITATIIEAARLQNALRIADDEVNRLREDLADSSDEESIRRLTREFDAASEHAAKLRQQTELVTTAANAARLQSVRPVAEASAAAMTPIVDKAAEIESKLRAAVAEMQRLQSQKAAGLGGPDIDAQLAKARGSVGGLTASLARFTGRPVAEVAASVGMIPPKADAATSSVNRTTSAVRSLGSTATQAKQSLGSMFSSLGQATSGFVSAIGGVRGTLLGLVGIGSATALGGGILKLSADAETLKASFTTLLGSGRQASDMVTSLQKLAAETPLSEMGVADAAKKMLAYGFAADSIIPTLTTVGDAATSLAGGGAAGEEALTGIVRAMGQMRSKGKTQSEEILQLAERGIPAWEMLANAMGVSIAEAQKRVAAGQVSGQMGIDALTKGMEERFGGGMKRMSQTTAGLFSTMIDSLSSVGRNIGEPFMPFVKSALKAGIEATSSLQAVLMPSISIIAKALGRDFKLNLDAASVTAFGDSLAGFTQTVIDAFTTAKTWVMSLSPTVLSMAGSFATALPVVSALATGFKIFAPIVSPVLSLLSGLGPALGLIVSPIGLVAAGVIGLGVALGRNAAVASAFSSATTSAWELVTSGWQMASEVAGGLWDAIKSLYAELIQTDVWKALESGVASSIRWIGALMRDVAFMARNWRQSATIISESVGLMWTNAKQAFSNIGQNFYDFIAALESFANGEGFNFQWTGLTTGFETSTERMQSAIAEMQANEEKRLRDQADANKKANDDSVAAVQSAEDEKDKARKEGAAANSETQEKIKKDNESSAISWVDVADRIKAGFEEKKPIVQPASTGRAAGLAADNAMIEAAKNTAMQPVEPPPQSTENWFSDGNEGARRRAASEASLQEAVTMQVGGDDKAHELLREQASYQQTFNAMLDKLVQAATSTGLKIEPQVAVIG